MSKKDILKELLMLGLLSQKKVSHKYKISHYLTRICFGLFGMVDSLKCLHLGSKDGFFDYTLYYTHMLVFEIIYEHHQCTPELKGVLKKLNKKFHRGDDILNKKGLLGDYLEDSYYVKKVTSDAVDSLTKVYEESLKILVNELRKSKITLEKLYEPSEKEKDLMCSFLNNLSNSIT